jgi:ABC-2 type transport system ATP-binding protein
MIEISHLSRRYGEFKAVDDVSFSVARGEVLGLLGHNGAGKTTVMKMLCGCLEPSSGSIRVDGLVIGRDTRAIQARIGYLPENCPVWPDMTVAAFLEVQAALHGVAPDKRSAAIAAAIRRTALKDRALAMIHTLSRGYRQRVGVAQALLHGPDIVILDEPTNGLDPTQILHMRELIRELARSATVIVSTHILQEVQAVCERVIIMRQGRKVVDSRIVDLQRGARLLLTLDRDEAAVRQVLQAVAGVNAIALESQGAGRFHYALQASADIAPAVSAALHAAGLALYALTPERRDLEAVFAEVNRLDAAAQAQAAPAPDTATATPTQEPQHAA